MKFKIEFKNDGTKFDDAITDHRKEWRQNQLGKLIADAFGWAEKGTASSDSIKFSLEIEAFSMDKWIDFKQELFKYIADNKHMISTALVLQMIKDLEFYSNNKKAVDAVTNLSDQMEYRGPDSHCKACEDEKNGVKHIMAQKHTCRK